MGPEDRGLTIGGYDAAFDSDDVGSFVCQENGDLFDELTKMADTFRDDGFAVFKGLLTLGEIQEWMEIFQERVNKLTEGDYLQYTCVLWQDKQRVHLPKNMPKKGSRVTICTDSYFLYFDMELHWNEQNQLETRVHLKENQQLLYLNRESAHPSHCFKNIPEGVCQRLAKLTTMTNDNLNAPLTELYPIHFKALLKAGLLKPEDLHQIPTLSEMMQTIHEKETTTINPYDKKQRARQKTRQMYFCVGKTAGWLVPIWVTIKKHRDKYGLPWLRPAMSYHRFPNLKEMSQADLKQKLNKKLSSRDFTNLECNCRERQQTGCDFTDVCRDKFIVYEVEDRVSKKIYIGATQQTVPTVLGEKSGQ